MRSIFSFLVFALMASVLCAQSPTDVEFGKNRVQYHKDFGEWSQYESTNFVTYWYGKARNIGQAAVVLAEYDFEEMERLLDHRMNDKIELIVYTDLTDFKQSNIGVEEAFVSTTGQTKIVGNKAFIYFNGDHNDLRRQIREGVAAIYIEAMLFGSNLQEIVQNAVLLHVPNWYKQGLIAYAGEHWSTDLDNELRDLFLEQRYETFEAFAEEQPRLAGHSLWYFISQHFKPSDISNLLYITRINRSVESAFAYVLGSSFETSTRNWHNYFEQRYLGEKAVTATVEGDPIQLRNRHNVPITQLKISPSGQYALYAMNEIGKYKVYLHDLSTGKRELIFKEGFRNAFQTTDYNYPLLAWHPSGLELSVLYEKRDLPRLLSYNVTTKKSEEEPLATEYQRIYSMDYVDGNRLVFSAAVKGFSDIFLYAKNTRQSQRITNDYYDDLDARFVNVRNRKGILWASNRTDSLLVRTKMDSLPPIKTFDIFYYDLQTRNQELVRVTNTPFANERQPMLIDSTYFGFLSDQTGIYNRVLGYLEDYIHHYEQVIKLTDGDEIVLHIDSTLAGLDSTMIDSVYTRPVIKERAVNHYASNYRQNILEQSKARRGNQLVELVVENGEHQIYAHSMEASQQSTPPQPTLYRVRSLRQIGIAVPIPETTQPQVLEEVVETPKETSDTTDDEDYFFQTDFDPIPKETTEQSTTKVEPEEEEYFFQSRFGNEDETLETEPTTPTENLVELDATNDAPSEELTDFELPSFAEQAQQERTDNSRVHDFRPARITPYRLKFRSDFVTMQLDNQQLFGGLNSVSGVPSDFGYPPTGLLSKANFKDLFEDYVIEGGVRFPTNFSSGSEYFLFFDDKKKRLDKRYAFYRRNLRLPIDSPTNLPNLGQRRQETETLLGMFSVRYPFDIFRSVRAKATLRSDATVPLASDSIIIDAPIIREQRIGFALEYVFDNTLDVALNIKHGTRYKVYAEVIKRFSVQATGDASIDFNPGTMTIVGLDFRHYQRLDKKSILAVRVAGATSFGSEKILYQLGGVDRWLFPSFNTAIPEPPTDDFAYRQPVGNLRGFQLNIRNGNSYLLLNSELRVPIFRYFTKSSRPFFRNFQMVGFFDVGTAWVGASPFLDESPLNTSVFNNGPVTVQVNYFRDPVVAGYGAGIRTMLFGYFLRVDRAWGIETRNVQEPRWFISLGMDF